MQNGRNIKFIFKIFLFIILTLFIFFIRIIIGNSIIPPKDILKLDSNSSLTVVIKSIRIPSFVSSFTIGAVLAVSGLIMQIILKNPLAEPYTLGISAGASFGCSFAIFLSSFILRSISLSKVMSLFAVIFGILSAILIFLIAIKTRSYTSSSLIISGIIVNSFFTALITILFYLLGQKVHLALSWMMGIIPLADKNWIWLILLEFLLIIIYLLFHKEFDLLSISGVSDNILGFNVTRFKQTFFLISSLGVSLIVAQSGIIPFIGIIVPYMLKLKFENHFKQNLVLSIFFGGNLLVIIDILTYLIPMIFKSSIQLPIGAVSGFLGAPFFLFLLINKRFK